MKIRKIGLCFALGYIQNNISVDMHMNPWCTPSLPCEPCIVCFLLLLSFFVFSLDTYFRCCFLRFCLTSYAGGLFALLGHTEHTQCQLTVPPNALSLNWTVTQCNGCCHHRFSRPSRPYPTDRTMNRIIKYT